ncbi:Rieske 2Fe-2S domain-containing protein [Novosphingobium sp. BL-52-GroH]|uniref:Rieske 2Fe-2S domain-containing protein n=1 Tax=Novosphingobium sp. BL-52-GroH TaxID=3349877 RepID=UPI00384CCAF4
MKRQDADLLTHVEGDAPMGALFRRYWLPVIQSARLTPGGAPIKVRILGEDYAAFRSPNGKAGLIGERCPHRGVSMLLARNEDCGLRCIQHGWAIDTAGTVVEAPNMPSGAALHQIPTNGRPVQESNGIVWAWFGVAEEAPPLTPYDFANLPDGHVDSVVSVGQCNWLQLLETLWDPYHVSVLHSTALRNAQKAGNAKSTYSSGVMTFDFEATPYGFFYHNQSDGKRIGTPFVLPCWSYHMLTADVEGDYLALGHVPVDNANHLMWGIVFNPFKPLAPDGNGRKLIDSFPRRHDYRDHLSRDNLWQQDRARMESGESFTGLDVAATPYGVTLEDFATIESMGRIYDRTQEHLAPTDIAIQRGRSRLLELLRDLQGGRPLPEAGEEVRGVLPTLKLYEPAV